MKKMMIICCILFLTSCASPGPVPARLYNLADGSLVNVQLSNYREGHGNAVAELPSGEKLKGEYTLGNLPYLPTGQRTSDIHITSPGANAAIPGKNEPSWQEVYGYGRDAQAVPVGTGTLVSEKGTILHMVFFTADPWKEIGDGVARSNAGHWYRFHVGTDTANK